MCKPGLSSSHLQQLHVPFASLLPLRKAPGLGGGECALATLQLEPERRGQPGTLPPRPGARETQPALPTQPACFLNVRGPAQTGRLQHQQPAGFADETGPQRGRDRQTHGKTELLLFTVMRLTEKSEIRRLVSSHNRDSSSLLLVVVVVFCLGATVSTCPLKTLCLRMLPASQPPPGPFSALFSLQPWREPPNSHSGLHRTVLF